MSMHNKYITDANLLMRSGDGVEGDKTYDHYYLVDCTVKALVPLIITRSRLRDVTIEGTLLSAKPEGKRAVLKDCALAGGKIEGDVYLTETLVLSKNEHMIYQDGELDSRFNLKGTTLEKLRKKATDGEE